MTSTNTFVRDLMTDGAVLPRARAIFLARILCRADIVTHLLQHGRNVRAGQLPAHMQAVFVATERALLGHRPTEAVTRANLRHVETGVTQVQRAFIWASGVDAYVTAGRLAGHSPTEAGLSDYYRQSISFGQTFGVDGSARDSVAAIEAMAASLLTRIDPTSVPLGGWVGLMQVTNADWFRRDSTISQADVIRAIEDATPPALVAALRRR